MALKIAVAAWGFLALIAVALSFVTHGGEPGITGFGMLLLIALSGGLLLVAALFVVITATEKFFAMELERPLLLAFICLFGSLGLFIGSFPSLL